jgi:type IV secretion system protein VirB9
MRITGASALMTTGILAVNCLAGSCKTVNMEPGIEITRTGDPVENPELTEEERAVEEIRANIDLEQNIIYVEKPVYIPEKEKEGPPVEIGIRSVALSNAAGIMKPEEYSHAARLYEYNPDQVYEVYTQTLRTTDIYLEAGELVLDTPFVSDSERWIIGAGINQTEGYIIQHIYVKPKEVNLEASLIINTDRRVYHLTLKSYRDVYMPMVKWSYPINAGLPRRYAGKLGREGDGVELEAAIEYVDTRYLSFDYRVQFSIFKRPAWVPRRVYDDGKKTYLYFEEQILQRELPGIFENRNEVINYRVKENLVIIDKLIEKVTVQYGNERIRITKKRGK